MRRLSMAKGGAARGRKRPRPGAIARPEVGRATEPPAGVSAHSGHAPCRKATIAAMMRVTESNVVPCDRAPEAFDLPRPK
jgi:hypothetical protein